MKPTSKHIQDFLRFIQESDYPIEDERELMFPDPIDQLEFCNLVLERIRPDQQGDFRSQAEEVAYHHAEGVRPTLRRITFEKKREVKKSATSRTADMYSIEIFAVSSI